MLLRGGFGDYVLDWVQNQNTLKWRQEGSTALDLGSHLPAKLSQSHRTSRALSLSWTCWQQGQWSRCRPSTRVVPSPQLGTVPRYASKEQVGSLSGLCTDPCLGLPASLAVELLHALSWILDSQSLPEQRLQLCFSENSSVFLLYNPSTQHHLSPCTPARQINPAIPIFQQENRGITNHSSWPRARQKIWPIESRSRSSSTRVLIARSSIPPSTAVQDKTFFPEKEVKDSLGPAAFHKYLCQAFLPHLRGLRHGL